MLDVVLAFLIPILKSSVHFKTFWHMVTDITNFGKRYLGSSLGHTHKLLSKFGAISFQDYVSQGITHPVFYSDLVYNLRKVKGEAHFISSGSEIVKRLWCCPYDPAITERTIGVVLGPFTALYRSFLKRCSLTRRLGLYDGPCLNLLRGDRLLIPVPSDC